MPTVEKLDAERSKRRPKVDDYSVHRHYFVDEAGDPTLFNRRKEVVIGKEGCSKYFILGCAEINDISPLRTELEALRADLLSDPYFNGVPSMNAAAGRTAVAFHAKDDPAEVRREVFKLLLRQSIKFIAIVRDKRSVLSYVRERNARDGAYRYSPNELYDQMVRRLFKERLHKGASFNVEFARR